MGFSPAQKEDVCSLFIRDAPVWMSIRKTQKDHFEKSFENLEQTIWSRSSEEGEESFTTELQTVLALSRNIESLTMSLNKEI